MSLAGDLIEQARHLARREPRRPRQASLRRAVSAAYYALFHLLTEAAAREFIRGRDTASAAQRAIVRRAFTHSGLRKTCASWWGSEQHGHVPDGWRDAVGADDVTADLQFVADSLVEVQQARHVADYDVSRAFSREDALDLVQRTEHAFQAWERVTAGGRPERRAFLLALLVQ